MFSKEQDGVESAPPRCAEVTTSPYHPPVKRSLAIAGHKTSISLEPLFWDMLRAAATQEGVAIAGLVARIDAERIRADTAPGLAGAIRIWLVTRQARTRTGGGIAPTEANEKGGEVAPAGRAEAEPGDQ
ncbi:MAG: ribbon-helix-helix domain-containing protein [Qipengyuania sp.]|nr:ribbon-helix-helix domain-containing protein [Qipengyuania sp.]